jgi:hypothetical protein
MQRKFRLPLALGLLASCALVMAWLWVGRAGALPPASQAISVYIDGWTTYMGANGPQVAWVVVTNRSQESYLVWGPGIFTGSRPKNRFSAISLQGFENLAPHSCMRVMVVPPTNLAAWCGAACVAPDRYRHILGQELQRFRNSRLAVVMGIAHMSLPNVKAEAVFSETVVRP